MGTRDSSRGRAPTISPAVGQQQAKIWGLKDRIQAFEKRSGEAERNLRDAVRLKEDGHDTGSVADCIAEIGKMPAELAELQGEFKRVKEDVEKLSERDVAARGSRERPAGNYDALSSMRVDLAGMSAGLDAARSNVQRAAEEAERAKKP